MDFSDNGAKKPITFQSLAIEFFTQMSGGGRRHIRVRRILPLPFVPERNSTLQSVGIRSHLL
jgi:hypothetical protein